MYIHVLYMYIQYMYCMYMYVGVHVYTYIIH